MEAMQYPHLFTPLRIGNVTLKNRIVASPSSQGDVNHDGTLNEHNIAYYACKARGGERVAVPADTAVIAIGMRPRRDEAESFLGCAPEVRILGNCAKVGQTMDAIRAGFDAGMFVD